MKAKASKQTTAVKPAGQRKLQVKKKGKIGPEAPEPPPAEPKRKLVRKTSDDAAIRACRLKLGMFPQAQVASNVNEKGETPVVMVKKEMKKLKAKGQYLSLNFWNKVIKDCQLKGTLSDGLKPPTEAERCSKELDSALRLAHAPNPAIKSPAKLLALLEYMPPCNRTEYYGLVCGACESPSLSKTMSHGILEGVMRYSARIRANELFPDYWEELSPAFDKMLSELWAKAQSRGMARVNFLRAWRLVLSLYFDMEVATKVEKCCEEKTPIDDGDIESLVRSSLIGSELWAPESQMAELSSYIAEIERRLITLEDENFSDEELHSFKTLCMHQAEALDESHWRRQDSSCNLSVTFCTALVTAPQQNPNDEWAARLDARVKTLLISNGDVPRFSWESALYGSGPLENIPRTVKVPERMKLDISNGREFVFRLLGDGWNSMDTIKKIIKSNLGEIKKLDKTFWLDEVLLFELYDDMISTKLKDQFLEMLPRQGEKFNLSKITTAARLFVTGPVVAAQRKCLERELVSALNLLVDISEARGPSALEASRMSPFTVLVLKRAENVHHMYVDIKENGIIKQVEHLELKLCSTDLKNVRRLGPRAKISR